MEDLSRIPTARPHRINSIHSSVMQLTSTGIVLILGSEVMRILSSAALVLAVVVDLFSLSSQRRPIPENPCELLAPDQLANATGLEILGMERKPGIPEIIRAQDENLSIGLGRLCVYKTETVFGDILIGLGEERDSAEFRQARDIYFAQFSRFGKAHP